MRHFHILGMEKQMITDGDNDEVQRRFPSTRSMLRRAIIILEFRIGAASYADKSGRRRGINPLPKSLSGGTLHIYRYATAPRNTSRRWPPTVATAKSQKSTSENKLKKTAPLDVTPWG
jgi:hypothetical protein